MISMHIATALIVHRASLECLRKGPLYKLTEPLGLEMVKLEYRRFTSSADAEHLIESDLRTIRCQLFQLGFDIR